MPSEAAALILYWKKARPLASVEPVAVKVLPFGFVTVTETAAPPIAFPFLSITKTVKYSTDFCVVVGGSMVSVTCRAPVLWVDVELDVVDAVEVDEDEAGDVIVEVELPVIVDVVEEVVEVIEG